MNKLPCFFTGHFWVETKTEPQYIHWPSSESFCFSKSTCAKCGRICQHRSIKYGQIEKLVPERRHSFFEVASEWKMGERIFNEPEWLLDLRYLNRKVHLLSALIKEKSNAQGN